MNLFNYTPSAFFHESKLFRPHISLAILAQVFAWTFKEQICLKTYNTHDHVRPIISLAGGVSYGAVVLERHLVAPLANITLSSADNMQIKKIFFQKSISWHC